MEIRVQFPRERARPAGTVGSVRPAADRQVDPGEQAGDHRQDGGHQQPDGHQHRPSPDADIGGHVDKTA